MHRVLGTATLAGCAVVLAGCGLLGERASPRASAPAPGSSSLVARADRTHEVPTPTPAPRVAGGWRTPVAAVTSFAAVYVNWTASTVAARLRALARASLGQARAELDVEAGEVAGDRELRLGRVGNSGTVEAVAPVRGGTGGSGGRVGSGRGAERFAVVTRERTTAADSEAYRGLAPQWHVAVATVARVPGGLWVVSGWQPEN